MKGIGSNYLYDHVYYNAFASSEYLEEYLAGRSSKVPIPLKQLILTLEECMDHKNGELRMDDLSKEILRECLSNYIKRKIQTEEELMHQVFNVSLDLRDFKGFRNHEIAQLIKFCRELGEKSSQYFSYRK